MSASPIPDTVYVAASIDVEEEGLFSGTYERIDPPITNTVHLRKLIPLIESGLKPTLFCAYSAFADANTRHILENLRDRHNVEIGAHLHHWNTPPIDCSPSLPSRLNRVPASEVPDEAMGKKFSRLFQIAEEFQGQKITSFRMGRWDLHKGHWQFLKDYGILCDASVRPFHCAADPIAGPDHFGAHTDPYLVKGILEIPLTVAPLCPRPESLPRLMRPSLKYWGALALLPVQHPLWLMKLATRLHLSRGHRTLSFTWHSSEMHPGGAPHVKDDHAVDALLKKLLDYLDWLNLNYQIEPVTMTQLYDKIASSAPEKGGPGDWN